MDITSIIGIVIGILVCILLGLVIFMLVEVALLIHRIATMSKKLKEFSENLNKPSLKIIVNLVQSWLVHQSKKKKKETE